MGHERGLYDFEYIYRCIYAGNLKKRFIQVLVDRKRRDSLILFIGGGQKRNNYFCEPDGVYLARLGA